jgi:hypothetical protein
MTILDPGPCQNWPPICDDFPEEPTQAQQNLIDLAIQAATEALWNRTKRQFGLCALTLRPCREECWPSSQWGAWSPYWQNTGSWSWPFPALVGGQWINMACGACGDHCSCATLSQVKLPYPIADVSEVKVDGVALNAAAYRVDDFRILVRLDGDDWPRCNDLNLADTEVGTWSVTATYGHQVPTLGQLAVGQLSNEIYKSCIKNGGSCLPAATVQQVTRQGVTKVFFDAETAFKKGKIGLYYPDLFIQTYNPSGTGMATIYDVDGSRRRHVNT